jgi:hypothetical protein
MTTPPTPNPRPIFTAEELSRFVPGLGTLMPEIGNRTWKLYYAAQAGNWRMAEFQFGEIRGLMRTGTVTRPAYRYDLDSFMVGMMAKVGEAVGAKDFDAFDAAFNEMVAEANDYHDGAGRTYIVWKLPDYPPPDLDLTPRE